LIFWKSKYFDNQLDNEFIDNQKNERVKSTTLLKKRYSSLEKKNHL
jgi:hypothetical protein